MADDVAGLIRELSGILQRISEQNELRCDKPEADSKPPADKAPQVREHPLEALQQQNQVLESVIERLKERPKKG